MLLLCSATSLYAVNPLHDTRYQLIPQPPVLDRFEGYVGVRTYGKNHNGWTVPLGISMGVNDQLEIGGRLDFDYHNELLLLLDIGAKIRLSKIEAVQIDLRFGEGWGAVVDYTIFHALNHRFSMLYTLPRVSFFEGLNGKEWVVFEVGSFGRVRLFSPIDFLLDLTYSSALPSLIVWSAFDIAVGTELKLINHSRLLALCQFGIAGAHESGDFGLKIGYIHGF